MQHRLFIIHSSRHKLGEAASSHNTPGAMTRVTVHAVRFVYKSSGIRPRHSFLLVVQPAFATSLLYHLSAIMMSQSFCDFVV